MEENKNSRKLRWRDLLKYIIPLIVSAGLCWLLFRDIDFAAMLAIIREQCSFGWIALGMAMSIVSHICRAFRWDIQLRALGVDAPIHALIYSIFGTYAVNLVFPRLGELWRCGYIAQRQNAPFTGVFGSMVADRLADTLTVLLLTAAAFLLASNEIGAFISENADAYGAIASLLTSPWLWGAVALCAAATIWLLTRKGNWGTRLRKALRELWQGFVVVLTMPGRGRWLLLTVGVWGCYFMQMYVALRAFPFTRGVLESGGAVAALVTFVLSSISMAVPSNGGIGPWQWAVIFALGFYGVAYGHAAAFANLVLGCNTLLLIVLGLITFAGIALDKKTNKKQHNTLKWQK